MARIVIVGGGGYVGMTYAAAFADLGHDVVGVDVDATKIDALRARIAPIHEPGIEDLLRRGLDSGHLRFETDYASVSDAEFVFICVGTPSDEYGRAEMKYITAAAREIALHAQGHTIVVNKSTMPVGSVELIAEILNEHASHAVSFDVVSNPEFLREGCALHDVFHPDRIVLGTHDALAAAHVGALYEPLGSPIVVTDPRSAEMIKYASNAFLATKISFINEVATICEGLGADICAVARGMGLDERIGPRFLQAGVGFGGSCFPKDVRALAAMADDAGGDASLLRAVLDINVSMQVRAVDKLATRLGGVQGKTIAVLGLAFKPNTDDLRESPALAVIEQLLASGATVRATDPVAVPRATGLVPDAHLVDDPYAAVTGADAMILMTDWAEYRDLDLDHLANAMRGRLVVDGRNVLDPTSVRDAGLLYEGIGRPATWPAVRIVVEREQSEVITLAAD